jgi:hypothetical protein
MTGRFFMRRSGICVALFLLVTTCMLGCAEDVTVGAHDEQLEPVLGDDDESQEMAAGDVADPVGQDSEPEPTAPTVEESDDDVVEQVLDDDLDEAEDLPEIEEDEPEPVIEEREPEDELPESEFDDDFEEFDDFEELGEDDDVFEIDDDTLELDDAGLEDEDERGDAGDAEEFESDGGETVDL